MYAYADMVKAVICHTMKKASIPSEESTLKCQTRKENNCHDKGGHPMVLDASTYPSESSKDG